MTTARPCLLERVEDAAIVQLYADGFQDLSPTDRVLTYHLSRAALAGRDIYYDQRYGHSLEMRALVEAVVRSARVVEPDTYARIHHYAKLFWLNSGPHNNLTARKFVPRCDPDAFDRAVRAAAEAGAPITCRAGETFDGMLARLRPLFFDPETDPIVTCKTPPPGVDMLAASANNLHVGVTMADLEGFEERYALNARLVKRAGELVEEVYRVGGRYGTEIGEIVRHLEAAVPHAPAPTQAALRALIRYYHSGDVADREAYDAAWVRDRDSAVDTINGFIEVYLDARGTKAAWESAVFYVNREKTDAMRALASHA
jgi:dipeptidyl-peptidase-3